MNSKQAAADRGAALVLDGMIVGLGSGSTATLVLSRIKDRKIQGIPTSEKTAELARSLGIPLTTLEENPQVDITIDGADQIERSTLNLIKGGGGALLHEKLVAAASAQLIIVADESKPSDQLTIPVPVEVVPFGWQTTARRLEALGSKPALRENFRTNEGNYILDCDFGVIESPALLAAKIDQVLGVVEHGLFVGMAAVALVGKDQILRPG